MKLLKLRLIAADLIRMNCVKKLKDLRKNIILVQLFMMVVTIRSWYNGNVNEIKQKEKHMIHASAVRNTTDGVRFKVLTTEPFIQLMARIEQEIVDACRNGEQSIIVNVNLMLTYANHKLPGFIDRTKLKNVDEFWWSFVCRELAKNGYNINKTNTHNHYEVSW